MVVLGLLFIFGLLPILCVICEWLALDICHGKNPCHPHGKAMAAASGAVLLCRARS